MPDKGAKLNVFIKAFLLGALLSGCIHNVPLTVDQNKDMSRVFPAIKTIPAKVGVYIDDDLKKYVYKQQKMGMHFKMNVGEYLAPISLKMGSSMFEDVIPVNSLPPYNDIYKPHIEAVVAPEILYCYGNAVGTLSGHIEGKVLIRITVYDLSGKVLWQDEAMGESRSREMSFEGAFSGGLQDAGTTGYDAAFAAAIKIVEDFNARPPKEFIRLLEINSIGTLSNRRDISNFEIFQNYYQEGRVQYEKKNYYEALYSFEKAENLNPDDQSTLFYIGVCNTYTGAKDKALEKFRRVVDLGPGRQEATDAKKWLDLLSDPLKIGLVNAHTASDPWLNEGPISQALRDSHMYELVDVNALRPPTATNPQKEWNQFLDRCFKRGIKIVIMNDIDSLSQKIRVEQQPDDDIATEHVVKISSKAYSAKRKEVKADIKIIERRSTIREKNKEEEGAIRQQLLKNGAEKLVLRLLENDIY
jgi:tetratricopeptide (TPR) repeat protein